jgi:hypothetical protein
VSWVSFSRLADAFMCQKSGMERGDKEYEVKEVAAVTTLQMRHIDSLWRALHVAAR